LDDFVVMRTVQIVNELSLVVAAALHMVQGSKAEALPARFDEHVEDRQVPGLRSRSRSDPRNAGPSVGDRPRSDDEEDPMLASASITMVSRFLLGAWEEVAKARAAAAR
jgi:hypothetical protein